MKSTKIYVIYKGDDFLFEGTISECADYLNVTKKTARYYSTPAHRKRTKGNGLIVIPINKSKISDEELLNEYRTLLMPDLIKIFKNGTLKEKIEVKMLFYKTKYLDDDQKDLLYEEMTRKVGV